MSSTPREVMPSATKNATAVDAGGVREDLWNFGDEVGLDEFLSNIPDGDEVSALGGVEKGKRGGNGLGNWDVLDEALSADIQSSAPVEVPGKKKSPPGDAEGRARRLGFRRLPRRGSGLERLARRQRPRREQERYQQRVRRKRERRG